MYGESERYESDLWENDVALFLDWGYLKQQLTTRGKVPNISAFKEIAGRYGRLVMARAYADWEDALMADSRDSAYLYNAGIEPAFGSHLEADRPPRRPYDPTLKLMIECLEASFTCEAIRTFVLASGEVDLIHLVHSLRSRGCRVVLLAVSGGVSRRMADAADHLLFYDREIERVRRGGERFTPPSSIRNLDTVLEDLVRLVHEQRQEGRYPLLSWLGHQMRRHRPDFSPQAYGFEKFKDLIRFAEQQGALKIVTQGLVDWALLPADKVPEEPLSTYPPYGLEGADSTRTGVPGPGDASQSLSPEAAWAEYEDVFSDIVRTANEIETDDRYDFMTPGFLGQCLWRKGHWDPATLPPGTAPASERLKELRAGQIRRLIDLAVEEGLLLSHLRFDSETGKTFPVVRISKTHPIVQQALSGLLAPQDDPPEIGPPPFQRDGKYTSIHEGDSTAP